jgi:RNA polymerase sigma-70 factor (ECF subfamily)
VDDAVFLAAVDRHKDMVFRVALNYLGSSFDADDVVQDVLLKLYTHEEGFADEQHLKHWLIRVTINICKNMLRSPWRRNHVDLDELTASVELQCDDEASELFQAVMSLKEKYRVVLYLFYYEDYTVSQIAGILGIKESAVTTRLSRARTMLRNGGYFDE